MLVRVVGNMSVAKYYFRIIFKVPKKADYLYSLYIMATVGYLCTCQKEDNSC